MKKEKTKLCKYCKSEISKSAKICAQCNKKQGNGIVFKILILFLCIGLFGSLFGGDNSSTDSEGEKEIVTNTEEGETDLNDEIRIEEQVLLNQNGIVITAKKYVSDSIWGDGIQLLLENNSDKTVMVGCHALIVNNYMITDLFATEIAAG